MRFFEKKIGEKNFRATPRVSSFFVVAGTLALVSFLSACASAPAEIQKANTGENSAQNTEDFSSKKAELTDKIKKNVAQVLEEKGLPLKKDSSDRKGFSVESLGQYIDFLAETSLKKGVPVDDALAPCVALAVAYTQEKTGKDSAALSAYADVLSRFPDSDFAAEALYRQGVIYSARRQFAPAFDCFSALEDSFPASSRVDDAIAQAYLVAEMVRTGVRPLKGGWMPWFKDRTEALDFYERLYAMAPHSTIAPRVLYHKGIFAFELSSEWFSFDKTLDAIDAFERMISIYPEAKFVPEAYLELAGTYEAGIVGADWDQLSTRRAISYYTDFYSLFPEHEKAEFAYQKTEELTDLLAANRLVIGDFYYSRHNNLRAALTFYNEAITLAPDSPAGNQAAERIDRIRRGERSERTLVDWIFGRFPNYDAVDYFDAPSLRPLDEMGFKKSKSSAENSGNDAGANAVGTLPEPPAAGPDEES